MKNIETTRGIYPVEFPYGRGFSLTKLRKVSNKSLLQFTPVNGIEPYIDA